MFSRSILVAATLVFGIAAVGRSQAVGDDQPIDTARSSATPNRAPAQVIERGLSFLAKDAARRRLVAHDVAES